MQQFKVGDWIENIRCVNQRIIKQVIDCKEHLDTLTMGNATNGVNVMLKSDVKLWQQKEGEWCWFYNRGDAFPVLRPFVKMSEENLYLANNIVCDWAYEYCEPFIGELPSFLKD